MFAAVRERTLGPFFTRRGAGAGATGLVAWVTPAEGSGRRVVVLPIDARGAPRGGETIVANVSVDTTMVIVRPLRGTAPGFVVAWTSLTDRGKSLWSVAIGDNGAARAKPVELTRTTDDIVWLDVVPSDHGAVCLWAEETRGGDANLVAAPIDTDGNVRGAPTRVAHGIVGWHALELPTGIGLSTVSAAPIDAKSRPAEPRALLRDARPGGGLTFHRLDADARPIGEPTVLTTKPIVSGDVEVARDGSRLVFAWTDRSAEEPSVAIAAINETGKVDPPRRLAEARGGASLLALAAGGSGVGVMFEAPTRRKGESRRIHVGKIGADLTLVRRPHPLDIVGRGQPELAATSTGFAIAGTLPDCEPDSAACANAAAVATILRTNDKMDIVQREPLTFQADPATLAWGMTCEGETCFSLAASPSGVGSPSRIRTAVVHPRTNTKFSPPVEPPRPDVASARVVDVTAVATGESVLDIATARMGDVSLVATLTAGADDRSTRKGSSTTLAARTVTENGEASAPFVITTKALAVGGVAIAGMDRPEDGGAVAWVSRESGDPEVHVTRIDRRGRRMNDVQLTATKGDANDVTITWMGGAWIVAWIDSRDGNGEVYATRVTPDLARASREERITNAPGDASDLVALARGSDVWLAWADPRESPRDGVADVYVTAVHSKDAKRAFDDQRLMPTAAHSRTPQLAAGPGNEGVAIAWIEEAPLGAETPDASGYGAFWALLDAVGRPTEKPTRIPLAGDGAATSVALQGAPSLRAIVARGTSDAISLDAVDLTAAPPRTASLITLDGPPSLDVALVVERDVVYFNDEGPRIADRRARRARIQWRAP
jgi:hypothetical protein